MDKRDLAVKLVANFGSMLTLPELTLDEKSNSCVLLFDGDIVLNIEFDETSGQLILSVYLDELPQHGGEPLLRELMVANLYWHRTDGATLGLEDATNGVILAQARAVTELDDSSFEKMVETFVNQAERWKKHIAATKTGAGASVPEMAHAPASVNHLSRTADTARIFG
jgi:hypothetical protein